MTDQPRSFQDPAVLRARLDRISEPHVAPLNEWVFHLRARLGGEAGVPWFDPADGGVAATILWLLDVPSAKAIKERGGSGIASCDNDDATAANTWSARVAAKVDRARVVHASVVPYDLGAAGKGRPAEPGDVREVGPLLAELLGLLPDIRCVILAGAKAEAAWSAHRPDDFAGAVVECPHPSPTNWNTRPGTEAAVVDAWRTAGRLATW